MRRDGRGGRLFILIATRNMLSTARQPATNSVPTRLTWWGGLLEKQQQQNNTKIFQKVDQTPTLMSPVTDYQIIVQGINYLAVVQGT